MTKFIFKTDEGRIEFSMNSKYVLNYAEGVNGYTLTRSEEKYPDTDGSMPTSALYEPRIVTVYGYIKAADSAELPKLRTEMHRILNGKTHGILICSSHGKAWFCNAVTEGAPQLSDLMQNMQKFVCSFRLYSFYWKRYRPNADGTHTAFYARRNMINGTFTLPAVFTKRETRLTLINYGDVPTGLRITITSGGYSGNADSSILITNHSTGAYMRLKYDLLAGETLTVDSDVFSIRKNGETNALHYLEDDDESDFFQLARGANDIEITTNYAENVFEADVAYYESFAAIEV